MKKIDIPQAAGITPTSARWEQASSEDSGKTWDANWIMEFRRVASEPAKRDP